MTMTMTTMKTNHQHFVKSIFKCAVDLRTNNTPHSAAVYATSQYINICICHTQITALYCLHCSTKEACKKATLSCIVIVLSTQQYNRWRPQDTEPEAAHLSWTDKFPASALTLQIMFWPIVLQTYHYVPDNRTLYIQYYCKVSYIYVLGYVPLNVLFPLNVPVDLCN